MLGIDSPELSSLIETILKALFPALGVVLAYLVAVSRIRNEEARRRAIMAGLIASGLFAIVGACAISVQLFIISDNYYVYSGKSLVISDFGDTDSEEYQFGAAIRGQTKKLVESSSNYVVLAPGEVITDEMSPSQMRSLRSRYGARVVVWGWYIAGDRLDLHMYIRLLDKPDQQPSIGYDLFVDVLDASTSENGEIEIQRAIAREFSVLLKALAEYDGENWVHAGESFADFIGVLNAGVLEVDDIGPIRLYEAAAYYYGQEYELAIQRLETKFLNDNHQLIAHLIRAHALQGAGQYLEALDEFALSLKIDDDNGDGFRGRALLNAQIDNHEAAVADWEKSIQFGSVSRLYEQDPELAESYLVVGASLAAEENHKVALERLDQALRLDPTLREVYYARGVSQMALGNSEVAVREFKRYLKDCSGLEHCIEASQHLKDLDGVGGQFWLFFNGLSQ